MEDTGSDGDRGPSLPWSYRGDQIGSNNPDDNSISSSSSGTIVSTTYTTSRGSRLSSISMDAVRHFELALDEYTELGQPTKKSRKETGERIMKHMDIKSLVQEFFGAPSVGLSVNINSNNSGDMCVLERWFSELGVAWVLHLPDGDDASAELHHAYADAAERWIRGLSRIVDTIRCSMGFVISGSLGQVTDSYRQSNIVPDEIRYTLFTKEAMSKMLPFVDVAIRQVVVSNNEIPLASQKKLHTLLAVYKALSDALDKIIFSSLSLSYFSAEVETCEGVMVSLLSAKQGEAGEAIWNTMESIRTRVLDSIDIKYVDGSSSSLISQASSDIHKATLSVMEYISFLGSNSLLMLSSENSSSMCQIISKAVCLGKHVPQIRRDQHMDIMIMDMKSCLQEKLVNLSQCFPDQGLRFLFLLNNFEFIRQRLMDNQFWCRLHHNEGERLSEKVEGYMENYLQACWEPVLSCLFSPAPLCFGINHSPLPKFESEFKVTYTTQKLWKVPDPELRKRLRTAITNKIVPRYTEYIEENNITTPGVAPQDLEKMLQELFEG